MLKELWLIVAASALVAGAQVHAEEVAVVEQEVREAVADLSAEEFKQAMDLAQAIQAGDVTLHDLDAIAQIQENRQKRSKIIKAAVLVAVSVAVVGTAGYLLWKKFGSSEDADTKGGKKGDKKDGDVAADAKKAREAADAKAEAAKEAKAAIKKARGAKKAEAQAAADKLEKEAAELEAAAVKAEKAAEEAVKKAEAEAKKAKDEAAKAAKDAKKPAAKDVDHAHDGDCEEEEEEEEVPAKPVKKPARRKAAKK